MATIIVCWQSERRYGAFRQPVRQQGGLSISVADRVGTLVHEGSTYPPGVRVGLLDICMAEKRPRHHVALSAIPLPIRGFRQSTRQQVRRTKSWHNLLLLVPSSSSRTSAPSGDNLGRGEGRRERKRGRSSTGGELRRRGENQRVLGELGQRAGNFFPFCYFLFQTI